MKGRSLRVVAAWAALAPLLNAGHAAASSEFASGPFSLPEGLTAGLGGAYLLSDANNDEVYGIPASGGVVTSGTPMGFRVFGEIALPSGYTESGQYLAYGTDGSSVAGVAALTGTSGLGAPATVLTTPSGWFTDAVVAPSSFGTIAAGQVVLGDNPGGVGSSLASSIVALKSSATSVSAFATLPSGVGAFGVGFAPTSFGAYAGDLFVSDDSSGNLYVLDATGKATLFATLPLPSGFFEPGLRQFAWAPDGFGSYGGDLFVSIAAQNGGGGATGEIDVVDAAGKTVAIFNQGDSASPLDPRGLYFVSDTTLLVANADPGIQKVGPDDFVPLPVPEPSIWAMLISGFVGLGCLGWRRTIKARTEAAPERALSIRMVAPPIDASVASPTA